MIFHNYLSKFKKFKQIIVNDLDPPYAQPKLFKKRDDYFKYFIHLSHTSSYVVYFIYLFFLPTNF
jgi:hypothetical protein